MNSSQFAWIYLIQNGAAGMRPAYYGGFDCCDDRMKSVKLGPIQQFEGYRDKYIAEIREFGVDWSKTEAPESDIVSKFAGTFCDPSRVEFLRGKLVLKNGLTQTWCAENLSVQNVFEVMASTDKLKTAFVEMFGEPEVTK